MVGAVEVLDVTVVIADSHDSTSRWTYWLKLLYVCWIVGVVLSDCISRRAASPDKKTRFGLLFQLLMF